MLESSAKVYEARHLVGLGAKPADTSCWKAVSKSMYLLLESIVKVYEARHLVGLGAKPADASVDV